MTRGLQKLQAQQKGLERNKAGKKGGDKASVEKAKTVQCQICKQTFMATASEASLHDHLNKHPKNTFEEVFPHLKEQQEAFHAATSHDTKKK
eukprot:m51a1_g3091 hypothetical protein (92) ;mRNA; r:88702-89190